MKKADLSGMRFGRLVAIEICGKVGKKVQWKCICDCGKLAFVTGLSSGHTKSCGCLAIERLIERATSHGMSRTSEYAIWRGMIYRCENKNHEAFARYGGRGIEVCKEWRESFEAFYKSMGPRPKNLTLDRIKNDGNYEPLNCKWSTRSEQSKNQLHSKRPGLGIRIEHEGLNATVAEWSKIRGIPVATLHKRLKKGLPAHQVLSATRLSANQYFRS